MSEWHSGCRLYRVSTLTSVRYALNSNDFGFDTEIILQLLNAGASITERAIPTCYGDEICRVNGLCYARQVMAASLGNALHRRGLVHQRRFEPVAVGYDRKSQVPEQPQLGAGRRPKRDASARPRRRPWRVGLGTRRERGCTTAVVDIVAPTHMTPGVVTHVADLNEELNLPIEDFDY